MRCKVSGIKIKPFMSFGKMPLANGFLKKDEFKNEFFYNLEVGFNEKNYLFQVNDHPRSKKIFTNKYPFFTSKSKYMVNHFKEFFFWLKKKYLKKNFKIIEIGSNDGSFAKFFLKNNFDILGFEPSSNVAAVSKKIGLKVVCDFFSHKNIVKLKRYKTNTDLICAANVICHIPNLTDLIKSIDFLLSKNGIFVFEEPYLGSMFKKISYDQIYDAHVFIFSLHSIKAIFNKFGFELIDAVQQKSHGGSMRYVISRKNKHSINNNVRKILAKEKKLKLDKIESCLKFKKNCELSKKRFKNKILKLKKNNKTICGYAASAKSTTAFNYCDISNDHIDFIADSTKEKIGKFTPGTHIPIVDVSYFRKNYPNYAILCSWNHKDEIINKERNFMKKGGKWIWHVK
jgi:SAM-dependent methyltransferase